MARRHSCDEGGFAIAVDLSPLHHLAHPLGERAEGFLVSERIHSRVMPRGIVYDHAQRLQGLL